MAFLTLSAIRKSYYLGKEEFPVLKGIALEFERGEFVSILGESGGGKTTLMNIIGGLDRKFSGTVTVEGTPLDHTKEKQMDEYRRAMVGYIYQSYNLVPHLTVLDNVLVALEMTTLAAAERKERALKLLDEVGLADHAKKHPRQLSGGQKQRVAIARALAADPQIIIADEPTGALDAQNTKEVLAILDQIAQSGKLVIAVTHSQAVADYGTRVVRLADGQIEADERLRPAYPTQAAPQLKARPLPALASYRTAFKHLMYNFWRNSLIMLGVGIGLFAVILFAGLGNGVNGYLQNQINQVANPQVISVLKNPTGKKMSMERLQMAVQNMGANLKDATISEHDQARIKKLAGVQKVEANYILPTYRLTNQAKQQSGAMMQTWSLSDKKNLLKAGHVPGKQEVVLKKQDAIELFGDHANKALIGKQVTLEFQWVDSNNQPVVIKVPLKVAGITEGTSSATLVNAQTIKAALQAQNALTAPNMLAVKVHYLDQVEAVATKINHLTTDNKRVVGAITIGSALKRVNTYVKLAANLLAAIAGISLLVSALMIIVTMYMSVSERTKEIGILRALGERKKDIRRLFTAESLLIGLFGALFALVLALCAAAGINHAVAHLIKYQIVQIQVGNVVFAFLAAIVISFLAAVLPARRAAKLNPIDALAED